MRNYTKRDIYRLVEEEDVGFIRLQFTDIYGMMKNIAITTNQLEKALDNRCVFDGSSIEGFAKDEDSDMYLYPDLNTFEIFPWRPQQGKVARLICDVYRQDGTPFENDPRHILKKTVEKAKAMGYQLQVSPKCEFFLFHTDDHGLPTTVSHENAGYFDLGPLDFGENARRDMVLTLEDMGFEIETSHHEAAAAQHEIDFRYDETLAAADKMMTFKLVVKTIAKRHGLHATFMPKPKSGENGSGMHLNMSLTKDGVNLFADENGENGLSQEASYFIGGIMAHIQAITLITNPIVNSYKRLVTRRKPIFRIPAERGEKTRVEFRSPDPSANPYLAFAVCLAAGLEGIEKKILPPEHMEKYNELLPGSLLEAVRAFEEDTFVQNVLGEDLSAKYVMAKKNEYQQFREYVTGWELEKYLHKI